MKYMNPDFKEEYDLLLKSLQQNGYKNLTSLDNVNLEKTPNGNWKIYIDENETSLIYRGSLMSDEAAEQINNFEDEINEDETEPVKPENDESSEKEDEKSFKDLKEEEDAKDLNAKSLEYTIGIMNALGDYEGKPSSVNGVLELSQKIRDYIKTGKIPE